MLRLRRRVFSLAAGNRQTIAHPQTRAALEARAASHRLRQRGLHSTSAVGHAHPGETLDRSAGRGATAGLNAPWPLGETSMCLVLVVWRRHAEFSCLVAANRDELYARPTARAEWWPDRPAILAGRDLEAGGTWLGMTRAGRFAALTNYRDREQRRVDGPSRGSLVKTMLESGASVAQGLEFLRGVGSNYNGFNLIFSDGERLGIYESERGLGR